MTKPHGRDFVHVLGVNDGYAAHCNRERCTSLD